MRRFYRALLRLYPTSFRASYGEEMLATFEDHLERAGPGPRRWWFGLSSTGDVVANAAAAHAELLAQDLRYTARTLARAPGFALTTILVVAIGVGANTAAFSVADFVLLRPLPFPEPDRLVRVWERTPGYSRMELSPANYRDWKDATPSFQDMGGYTNVSLNLVGDREPQRVDAALVTGNLFQVLGVAPALGRTFMHGDDPEDAQSVVLSHGLWETELGGTSRVLGRTVVLDGTPFRVIGVMPETFRFPDRGTRLWIPLTFDEDDFLDRNNNYVMAVGRLAPGRSLAEAQAELERASLHSAETHPASNAETRVNAYALGDDASRTTRLLLAALGGAALCILILACANLTNLLLARGAARAREVAVRTALGAGRERLIRQLVTESAVLALVGGVSGVALAMAALPFLEHMVPWTLPIAGRPELDLRVLTLALAFTVLTGLGFGALPALQGGGRQDLEGLREGGRGGTGRGRRGRGLLVSVQIAASVVLLVCSGLLMRAMWRLHDVDPGFRTEGVLTVRTALPRPRYDDTALRARFYARVLDDVRALPGVAAAAYTTGVPMDFRGGIWPVSTGEGEQVVRAAANSASLRFVTPGFFDVLQIPIEKGRPLGPEDSFFAPLSAVVSTSFAERYWPDQSPIGKRFTFAFAERTIVGVARDIRVRGLQEESEPQVYLPHEQVPNGGLIFYAPKDLIVAADVDPMSLVPAVRRIVAAADPAQPLSHIRTMAEVVAADSAPRRAQLRVIGVLAGIALLLAGIGVHGLLAYTVSLRSREIGVRMALGARRGEVARMVLLEGVTLAALGLVPGVLLALAAGRALGSILVGVPPTDPAVLGIAVSVTALLALAGSLAPALRAVRVDPSAAMSAE